MTAPVQFIVLKCKGKWSIKSRDLERFFSMQREAMDAAIRLANDSGKEGKPAVALIQKSKIENRVREDLDIRRKPLSPAQIGFARDRGRLSRQNWRTPSVKAITLARNA
jgi:hypothetical protein